MPVPKETRAHQMQIDKVRQRNSMAGSITAGGSPTKEAFKMKRFAEVQGRVSTNRKLP